MRCGAVGCKPLRSYAQPSAHGMEDRLPAITNMKAARLLQ
jgi:hypothetical protein